MNTVLPEPGGTANERVAGIFAAASVRIGGIAGMQGKIVGRASAGDRTDSTRRPNDCRSRGR